MTKLDFKGYDWTELLPVFGYTYEEGSKDEDNAAKVREGIRELSSAICFDDNAATKKHKKQIRDVRRWLRTISRYPHCYDAPVWAALAEVKSPWTMLWYVDVCLEGMWT